MELTPTQRNLISRSTLLLVGVILLWCGSVVFGKGNEFRTEWVERNQTLRENGVTPSRRDSSGAVYMWLLGVLLLGSGSVASLLAIVPTQWLTRISVAPTTGKSFD